MSKIEISDHDWVGGYHPSVKCCANLQIEQRPNLLILELHNNFAYDIFICSDFQSIWNNMIEYMRHTIDRDAVQSLGYN